MEAFPHIFWSALYNPYHPYYPREHEHKIKGDDNLLHANFGLEQPCKPPDSCIHAKPAFYHAHRFKRDFQE
ncbi:hypothetical protein VNO77_04307 [Canavalia gladiata]|uniref:Uncharacterized protein n=1 Tax=Canavalia gladiata TaxID=3824 RepID=A0AAN9MYC3_CANGL